MKFKLAPAVVGSLVVFTSGCSWLGLDDEFRDRGADYQTANVISPLKMPKGLKDDRINDMFIVPDVPSRVQLVDSDGDYVVPRPQALDPKKDLQRVRIQRLGDQQWVSVNVGVAEVWPRIRAWLNQQGVKVAKADPESGLIQTQWLQFKDDEKNSYRFNIMLESGYQTSSAELHIVDQMVAEGKESSAGEFPAKSDSKKREDWLVKAAANALASQSNEESVSLLASNIGGEPKAKFINTEKTPYLRLNVSFDRAWASVIAALKSADTTLDKKSIERKQMEFSYHPVSKEKDSGWFSWFSSSDKKSEKGPGFDIRHFTLDFVAANGYYKVLVSGANGETVSSAKQREVLTQIENRLN